MTPHAQQVAIAVACKVIQPWMFGSFVTPNGCLIATLPDYLNDLNAMHAACLTRGQIDLHNFAMELRKIIVRDCDDKRLDDRISDFWFYNATAAQRAEAFLRTLNLWKD